jgi:hypothetical protein
MSFKLMYHEIVEQFQKAEKRVDKIEVLRKHADDNFLSFLKMAIDPRIVFDVEIPVYKPSILPAGMNDLYLHSEVQRLYRFIKNHPRRPEGLTPQKQKSLLIALLEALHKEEADLLIRCINKDLKVPFLTPKLLADAFPGFDVGTNS